MAKLLEGAKSVLEMIATVETASGKRITLEHGLLALLRQLVDKNDADEADIQKYYKLLAYGRNHEE